MKKLLLIAIFVIGLSDARAQAAHMGYLELRQPDGHATSVFYPASGAEVAVRRGPFELSWVSDGAPLEGNRRLVVISHGSGGSPWVHVDLARALVRHGYTVAIPMHHGDNYLDPSDPGPVSWRLRPQEVSQAIDRVGEHAALARLLSLDAVGVFGGSAGGHTALSLAGGQWSDANFKAHCDRHIEEDFSSCVGSFTLLRGDGLDGLKVWAAHRVINRRFTDPALRRDRDPRIVAAIAMVPFAADFTPESLATPSIPLGLVIARKDINQVPRFHAEAVLKACAPRCELVMDMQEAGHGAMLSPMPPLASGSVAKHLLADPPTYDRKTGTVELNERIADFYARHLLHVPRSTSGAAAVPAGQR